MLKPIDADASTQHGRPARPTAMFPMVMVNGCAYLVDLGPRYALRFHTVQKDKTCSCGQARCHAVKAVEVYLKRGGQRAPEGVQTETPVQCPICAAPLAGGRGRMWTCTRDVTHYHLFRVQRLRALAEQHRQRQSPDVRAYWTDVQMAFESTERVDFLNRHQLKYPAGS